MYLSGCGLALPQELHWASYVSLSLLPLSFGADPSLLTLQIAGNLPGAAIGGFAGSKLGAVRDAKGKAVYEVFKVRSSLALLPFRRAESRADKSASYRISEPTRRLRYSRDLRPRCSA